jgi:CxxC motif-containing protein
MLGKKNLVCIICPMGCQIAVQQKGDKIGYASGYKCMRGKEYALAECINPVRALTSTVKVFSGQLSVAPVKSDNPIPKQLIPDCIKEINRCSLQAPIKIGDIVISNILDTGINIVATSNISGSDRNVHLYETQVLLKVSESN